MKCCSSCFNDWYLKEEVVLKSNTKGRCEFCRTAHVSLIDTSEFQDGFEMVCSIYNIAEDGKSLLDLLNDDWQIFAKDNAHARKLLGSMLPNERIQSKYKPPESKFSNTLDAWKKLSTELRTKNRYFPDSDFKIERYLSELESLRISSEKVSNSWYRARIENGQAITADKMGAPPPMLARSGRANPVGIPYLYVGSTPETAITEVRPHEGEIVTVAHFTVDDGFHFIDLRQPRQRITPFVMEDATAVATLRGDISFFERLGQELSTPVVPQAVQIDYIPSQFLCELMKKAGYDGVVYNSSVSDGINLALFSPSKAKVGTVERVKINKISVTFDKHF